MSTSPIAGRYHHGDLRRALLAAGMDLLAEAGPDGVGLRELARMVGVSAAAPYRHFDSKTALLEALAVTGFRNFALAVETAAQAVAPPEQLKAMGRAYVRFALDNQNLFRLMFSPELKRDERPILRMAANAAFTTLRAATATGADGRIAALGAWAQVHGLAVLMLDGQIALREGEDVDGLIAAIVGSAGA